MATKIAAIPATSLMIGPLLKNVISTFYACGAWVPSQWIYLIALAAGECRADDHIRLSWGDLRHRMDSLCGRFPTQKTKRPRFEVF
jgi:hypothetical protein